MLVDITAKLVADAINSGLDSGKPITVNDAGRIIADKAAQVRAMPGMSGLDVFDLASAVTDRLGIGGKASLGIIQAALRAGK